MPSIDFWRPSDRVVRHLPSCARPLPSFPSFLPPTPPPQEAKMGKKKNRDREAAQEATAPNPEGGAAEEGGPAGEAAAVEVKEPVPPVQVLYCAGEWLIWMV
jgi:hypothetical protein